MSAPLPALLVDTNVLVYAVDGASPFHPRAVTFLEEALNGPRPVGFPWEVLTAFVRLVTHPRVARQPLTSEEAWSFVEDWSAATRAWHPAPTERHGDILKRLVTGLQLTANLVPDAHLAAIAIGHGLTVASADSDFALFEGQVAWLNPLAA